jgi:hypothetical protein
VFACGTALNNVVNGTPTLEGNGLIVWWDFTNNPSPFTSGTTKGLGSEPAGATKTWGKSDAEDSGIHYINGANTGFIKVAGVTVN